MALPPSLRPSVTPLELEMIAGNQLITILPSISMEKTALISGAYGPLVPMRRCQVPLWMAINLKLKRKCRIIAPDWLTVGTCASQRSSYLDLRTRSIEVLQAHLARETTQPEFSDLPFRFSEVSKLLLDVASDDLENPDKIRSLLKDLREARQAKSREGLDKLDHNELTLLNLCSMEINEIRPFFVRSMDILAKLQPTKPPGPEELNSY
jgi:GINS complex subunit 2